MVMQKQRGRSESERNWQRDTDRISVVTNCAERIEKIKEDLEARQFAAALGTP